MELTEEAVIIRRRGWANALTAGINGDRTIAISTITAIQVKMAGLFTRGYILFSYAGSKPFRGGLFEATEDPDAFLFGEDCNGQITELKARVEELRRALPKKQATTSTDRSSVADELVKLARLKDTGVLSPEEFERAKRKLLE